MLQRLPKIARKSKSFWVGSLGSKGGGSFTHSPLSPSQDHTFLTTLLAPPPAPRPGKPWKFHLEGELGKRGCGQCLTRW